ncbi:hypothetical protein MKX01_008692, partial [Papaver californicum]
MAPVLSRNFTTSIASLPSFSVKQQNNCLLKSSLFNPNLINNRLVSAGALKWKLNERYSRRTTSIKCDSAVAEKETVDAPEEKFEYQAE